LVRALAEKEWEDASAAVLQDPDDPWTPERFEESMKPFYEEYGELVFTPEARRHQHTHIREVDERVWEVAQTILDPQGDNLWAVQGIVDLRDPDVMDGPLVKVSRVSA
jgi:hypothetical protein